MRQSEGQMEEIKGGGVRKRIEMSELRGGNGELGSGSKDVVKKKQQDNRKLGRGAGDEERRGEERRGEQPAALP